MNPVPVWLSNLHFRCLGEKVDARPNTVRPFSDPAPQAGASGAPPTDPRARVLNALIISVLGWVVIYGFVFLPRFSPRPAAAAALLGLLAATSLVSMAFLKRGAFRIAGAAFLTGTCLTATVLVSWAGGIHSPALVLYAAIPMAAAWLLGH